MPGMTLQETLRAYAAKAKTTDDVMRAMMNHDAWQAPVMYATQALGTTMFERISVWGNAASAFAPGELWLFTDDAAANAFIAKGGHGGPYASPIQGWKLFGKVPDNLTRVRVNPGSPPADTWGIEAGGMQLTRLWANAIELEWLLGHPDDRLAETVANFGGYTAMVLPNGAIATAMGAGGMKNPGMLFTTPDCAQAVLREMGPDMASKMKLIHTNGRELFGKFSKLGVDGFVFNVRGPGTPQILPADACAAVIRWIDFSDKAARADAEAKAAARE